MSIKHLEYVQRNELCMDAMCPLNIWSMYKGMSCTWMLSVHSVLRAVHNYNSLFLQLSLICWSYNIQTDMCSKVKLYSRVIVFMGTCVHTAASAKCIYLSPHVSINHCQHLLALDFMVDHF